MSNSKLTEYIKLSQHHSGKRTHKIDTITIHIYGDNHNVESMGQWFSNPIAKASSNYGIDSNGKIALFVDEDNRSWCSSNRENDNRAITIEVANINKTNYEISEKAYKSLIALLTDICIRNDIECLKWKNDKSLIGQVDKQNITLHKWFKNKTCPGEYIIDNMERIAHDVNCLIDMNHTKEFYRIQVGAFTNKKNADNYLKEVRKHFKDAYIIKGE